MAKLSSAKPSASNLGKLDMGMASSPKAGTKPLNVANASTGGPGDTGLEAKADAHTLVEAAKIKADKGRHGRAKAHIKQDIAHRKAAAAEPSLADGDADDNGNAKGNYGNYGV